MTRLERHRQRQTRNRTLVLGVIIIAVVIFFLTVGVPLFVNLSRSVGSFFAGPGKKEELGNTLEFSEVEITTIPEATNSAELEIGGTVANVDNLTIYLNGSVQEKIDVSGKSEFTTLLHGLESGTNEVYASGSLKGSTNMRETQKYTVVYRSDKPTLEITAPTDGTSTPRDEVQVTGKTDSGSEMSVRVNGQPTVVSAGGSFQSPVKLKEGENKIVVTVSDLAGNIEEKTVTVKYEK